MKQKIPPQAIELEKAALGIALLEKEAINIVTEWLRPEMFYSSANQIVFAAMMDMFNKGQSIDMLTIADRLKSTGELNTIGGLYYLTDLTNNVVSSAHTERHCKKIVEKYLLRQLAKITAEIYTKSYDEMQDPFELIETLEKAVHGLSQSINAKDYQSIDTTLLNIAKELEEKRHRKEHLTGVPTQYPELDRSLCGWQPTNLVILAARPKCGKTAAALNFGLNASTLGFGVGIFSMEMSAGQVGKRLIANKASIFLQSLRDARLDDHQMVHLSQHGISQLVGLPFYIDDTAALTVAEFKSKARRMVKNQKVKLLIIDYLQLMQPERGKKNQTREQEVATIARQLKIIAKELNVPIIALSQLSREVEKRGNHIPQLSDLRESGSLEQDADIVMFLYKPSESEIADDRSKETLITLKIAAYRDGEPRSIDFDFDGRYQRFTERGLAVVTKFTPLKKLDNDGFPGSYSPTGTDPF